MGAPAASRPSYFYIDLLRAMAAVAVVVIHVLGPYRGLYGQMPTWDWLTAIGFNISSRWAVPVFIMISGALMLPDTRPFNLRYYLSRRVSKVVVPFLVWSVLYAFLAGLSWNGHSFAYELAPALGLLKNLPEKATWYHLGFYYYFIPLYLVIPFLTPWVQKLSDDQLRMLVLGWLVLTLLYLMRIQSDWMINMIMYGGYLPLGYALTRMPLNAQHRQALIYAGGVALIASLYGVWELSSIAGKYTPGRYTSYKTLNTVVVAAMLFVVAHHYGDRLSGGLRKVVSFVGRYSLGLYLVHPLLLWPLRQLGVNPGLTLVSIPLVTALVTALSLLMVWGMSKSKATAWLVP